MLTGGSEFGGYRIEGVLGQGGMGTVYEATQLSLNRTIALKVLSAELSQDAEFRERFRREGRQQAAIEHAHIVAVYEAGEAEQRLYIAMRLIRGATLKQLIVRGELDDVRALRLLTQVADALDAAHEAGLIHRDVKPQNVLVGRGDHAHLADFGLTKAADQTALTVTGTFMGTLDYAAPEQLRGETASAASDIYALAAVVHECLTGTVPFRRLSGAAVISAHLFDPPPRVSDARPELPNVLDEAVRRGLAKEPTDRQPTAGTLMEEVERALGGQVHARPAMPRSPAPSDAPTSAGAMTHERTPPREVAPAPPRAPAVAHPAAKLLRRRPLAAALATTTIAAAAGVALLLDGDGTDAGAPAPHSAVEQIGSSLSAPGEPARCNPHLEEACTLVQTRLAGARVTSPIDGVVTRWRVRDARGDLALQIVSGSARKQATGPSSPGTPRGRAKQSFAARLRISRGDAIALLVPERGRFGTGFKDQATLERFSGSIGPTPTAPDTTHTSGIELLLSADVEPDKDGDGWGDVSQDGCPGEAGGDSGC